MKTILAFFRLIRWPNLLFIVVTQILFYYCVYTPLLIEFPSYNKQLLFFLLSMASVLIAAAGYIINDYFDIQIDIINKPDKIVINKFIKRRWAIIWHFIFSALGVVISFYVSVKTGEWLILVINFLCVLLLWVYSTTFKRKLLSGNLIIAALTAWVIIVIYLFVGADIFSLKGWAKDSVDFNVRRLFKFTLLFASFAFIMTLIREVIKDLEDMEGDRKYHCTTMPIIWGVPASKVFTAVWIVVCVAALGIVQLYAWQSGWWFATFYILLLLVLPLLFLLNKLYKATTPAHYKELSSIVKIVILFGILSMLFLKFTV
ncbi:MAG: geranylgeranylglycerol-phosphate geranylgeranyltransferase [Ferruginibacter sp.]|nr:geranylgeranylglycerol-phosphate geranylgeranyltransferase [Ferruginibacter sp.]